MTIFYFTATGNSLDVAKRFGEDAVLRSIPQERGLTEFSDDVIGVVFPVYAANLPAIVTQFLRRVTLNAYYKFAVITHGGGPGEVCGVLANTAKFDNIYTVETWSNYLPFNDDEEPAATDVTAEIARIAAQVKARERREFVPGGEPFVNVPWAGMAKGYIRDENCTLCGTCAKVCPAANIEFTGTDVKFSDRCESCMACLQNCPAIALHVPNEPTRYRYRNPNITADEIIAANNQSSAR